MTVNIPTTNTLIHTLNAAVTKAEKIVNRIFWAENITKNNITYNNDDGSNGIDHSDNVDDNDNKTMIDNKSKIIFKW